MAEYFLPGSSKIPISRQQVYMTSMNAVSRVKGSPARDETSQSPRHERVKASNLSCCQPCLQ